MPTMSDIPTYPVKQNVGASNPLIVGTRHNAGMTDTLGSRLKALRKQRKMTQADVAAVVGVSRSTLTGYERDIDPPGRESLAALATFYGVPIDLLYGAAPAPEDPKCAKDQDESALLAFWRTLDEPNKRLFLIALARGRDGGN
jgi:transcriptional regulator with XRE-family HTH domain